MELSIEEQIGIIERQINDWRRVAFNAETAHKVHTKLESPKDRLEEFVGAMIQAEKAITFLMEMRNRLLEEVSQYHGDGQIPKLPA